MYAIFGAVYRFKLHQVAIKCERLPESFDGLKIVHISDLHLGSFGFRYHILERAIDIINNLNPDLILFTGDLVNNYGWELRGWAPVLEKLKAKKGKFSVLGNHDYGDYSNWETEAKKIENFESIKNFYKAIGFKLLCNEAVKLNVRKDTLAIVGVENWGKPPLKQYGDLDKALHSVHEIPFKLLLTHDPSHWDAEVVDKTDIALTFSGHTHGMQAGFIIGNKQWSPIQLKYKQWAGLYQKNQQHLYVTRGLGWLGFPGRIGMRPEITSIELVK
jgi:predicted MPP superfamily phosphohydrolase